MLRQMHVLPRSSCTIAMAALGTEHWLQYEKLRANEKDPSLVRESQPVQFTFPASPRFPVAFVMRVLFRESGL
jgi:hypothetical protein